MAVSAFLLDTSAYSGFNRGDQRLRKWFSTDYTIMIPLIVVAELRAGFAAGSKTIESEKLLQYFLDSSNVQIAFPTLETTKQYAALFLELRKAGNPIGTNDLWIAALALEHKLPILSLDNDFHRAKGIKVVPI